MASITGQLLYEAFLVANPDLAYTWRDLGARDKQVYVEVATALNSAYLAPLQKQPASALTGEDVAACLNLRWERFCTSAQVLYEEIATKLNAQYITPLQEENNALKALVREYQSFVTSIPFLSHEKKFLKSRELLEKSFQLLLSEEQKVSV